MTTTPTDHSELRALADTLEAFAEGATRTGHHARASIMRSAAGSLIACGEALLALIPRNIGDNPNVPDSMVLPCDVTMGEIRQARQALSPNPSPDRAEK